MARWQLIEAEVEDLVSGMQYHIRCSHESRIPAEQRNGAYADILLEWPRWRRAQVKSAVDHRPRAPRRGALNDLDAEQRRHDGVRPPLGDDPADRLRGFFSPCGHALFHKRSGG